MADAWLSHCEKCPIDWVAVFVLFSVLLGCLAFWAAVAYGIILLIG